MYIKKRFFTLIEVIVSLTLITIVITILFGYFTKISKVEQEIEDIKKIVYKKSNLQIRLNNIFAQLYSKDFNQIPFYTEVEKNEKNLSLCINFDNGVDPDPNFSDVVKAKIFIDKNSNLILEIWSKDKKTKITRKEILFTAVNNLEYKFLSSNDLQMKSYEIEKITDTLYWYNFWPKERNTTPSVIYMKINKDLDFAFFLPSQGAKI